MYKIIINVEPNTFIPPKYLDCDIIIKLKYLIDNYGLNHYFLDGNVYELSTFKKTKKEYTFTAKDCNGSVYDLIFDEEDLNADYVAWFSGNGLGKTQFCPYDKNIRSYVVLERPFPAIKNHAYTGVITDEEIL